MKRVLIGSVALGLLAILLAVVPASASGSRRSWPALWVHAYANDDGRAEWGDPGDVGDVTASYDRWGRSSSDDPSEPGMDAERVDGDVARCEVRQIDTMTLRVRMQNAYPGYTCTFVVSVYSRIRGTVVLSDIRIDSEPALELGTLDSFEVGEELARGRKVYGTYSLTVLQEAPQGATLDLGLELGFVRSGWR